MTTEQNKETVRRHLELVSSGDVQGSASLFAPLALNHGREASRSEIKMVLESVATLKERFTIQEMVAEGEWVACRATVTGKFDAKPEIPIDGGIFAVSEPTGKEYVCQHIHLYRVVDGKIVEHWATRDDLGAARQVGLDLHPSTSGRAC